MTKEKIAAIQKQLRSGLPEGEIKEELRKEGYTEEEIKQAFTDYQQCKNGFEARKNWSSKIRFMA